MKRILTFLLALLLLLPIACAEDASPRGGADMTYARVATAMLTVRERVMGDYMDVKQIPEDAKTTVRTWAQGITDAPRLVVQLDIDNWSTMAETRAMYAYKPEVISMEGQSNALLTLWMTMLYSVGAEGTLTDLDAEGISTLNSYINTQMLYADQGRAGYAMYIVLYDDATPVVLMVSAENGVVSVLSKFLPSAKLAKCQNYGQVALWLMKCGTPISCWEIKPE